MNAILGREGITTGGRARQVTLALLDKWVAAGAGAHVIPLRLLPVFCAVTGTQEPLRALCGTLGCELVVGEEVTLLAWARHEAERRRLAKAARRLAEEAGIP